jgi:hypothetical protein
MAGKKRLFDDPSEVEAAEGNVEVEGPDEVDIAMTPGAAEETSERLLDKAMKARGQRRLKKILNSPDRGGD